MAEEKTAEAQAPEAEAPEQDARPGYEKIVTGSTKHPEAKESEDGRVEAVIGVFVGDTLQDAVDKYGEEFVRDNFIRSVVVTSQGKVRRELDNGTPISTVEAEFDDLDPTEQRSTIQDPQTQAMRALQKMDPEQRKAFFAMLEQD